MRRLLFALALCLLPVRLDAAITVTEKLVMSSTDNLGGPAGNYVTTAGSWTTQAGASTFAIASGAVGLCFTMHGDTDAPEAISSFTHNGAGWTNITSQVYSTNGRIEAWRIAGPRASSAITVSMGGADNQTGLALACYELAGADTGGTPVAQSKIGTSSATTSHTLTLDSARTASSALFFGVGSLTNHDWTAEYAGVGVETGYTTPVNGGIVQWDIGGADTTPLWTSASNGNAGFIAVEIKVAAAGGSSPCGSLSLLGVGCAP